MPAGALPTPGAPGPVLAPGGDQALPLRVVYPRMLAGIGRRWERLVAEGRREGG